MEYGFAGVLIPLGLDFYKSGVLRIDVEFL
jgi:hypothetical protein